jgi:NAD(P)-dependent dehydrogenase (short-subunit alcohol dehydrogenase family)
VLPHALLVTQAIATLALTGLIWLVQLVHYPGFMNIDSAQFGSFHTMHSTRITWIVAPLMVIELLASVAWCFDDPRRITAFIGLALVAVVWASTAFVQVPLHSQLSDGFSVHVIERLVRTNWIRTLAWSARSILVITWLLAALQSQGLAAYRGSKAAQNMFTKTIAIELGRVAPNAIVVGLHPGTVDTALSKPFQRGVPKGKLFSTERSVGHLLQVIGGLTPQDSGKVFAWDGSEIPP